MYVLYVTFTRQIGAIYLACHSRMLANATLIVSIYNQAKYTPRVFSLSTTLIRGFVNSKKFAKRGFSFDKVLTLHNLRINVKLAAIEEYPAHFENIASTPSNLREPDCFYGLPIIAAAVRNSGQHDMTAPEKIENQ